MSFIPSPSLSFWEHTTYFGQIDLAIVGGGIVGLSAAIRAQELAPNAHIVLLERGPLPAGASTKNAGFACFGSMTELLAHREEHGEAATLALVEQRWRGLQLLRKRLGDDRLGYQPFGGYEVFRPQDTTAYDTCLAALPELNRLLAGVTGAMATFRTDKKAASRFGLGDVAHVLFNKAEGQVDTGNMMYHLEQLARSRGIRIINGLHIESMEEIRGVVQLSAHNGWQIRASRVLVATNGFAQKLIPRLQVRPVRNQVLITKPIFNLALRGCFHYDRGYFYFRNVGARILLGGGRHLGGATEETDQFGTTPFLQETLVRFLKEVVAPQHNLEIDYWWSGILGVGEGTPIVQAHSDRIAVAVRLGGMGVAIGSLVGQEAAELIFGD